MFSFRSKLHRTLSVQFEERVTGGKPLCERQRGHHWSNPSPDPSCPALHQTFFFADWLHNQIPSEWAGVGWVRGEQKVGPLPLDNAIISAPLARNAKFHSLLLLSVRQSKLREGPRRPLGPPPAPCDPIQPLIPQEPDHTRSVRTSSLQLGPSSNF